MFKKALMVFILWFSFFIAIEFLKGGSTYQIPYDWIVIQSFFGLAAYFISKTSYIKRKKDGQ